MKHLSKLMLLVLLASTHNLRSQSNCTMTADAYSLLCFDNNTQKNASDDFYIGWLYVTPGDAQGTGWTSTWKGQPVSGMYNTDFNLGYPLISTGNADMTITDNADPNCFYTFTVIPPPACSNHGKYDYKSDYWQFIYSEFVAGEPHYGDYFFTAVTNVETGHFYVDKIYLSTDNKISGGDVLLGTRDMVNFIYLGTTQYVVSVEVVIPANTTPGTYWLLADIDAENDIKEKKENNNVVKLQINVVAPQQNRAIPPSDKWTALPSETMKYHQPMKTTERALIGAATPESIKLETNVFPNPATDAVNLNLSAWEGKTARLTLLNALGQTVLEKTVFDITRDPVELELGAITHGQYFLKMETAGQKPVTKRLIVE